MSRRNILIYQIEKEQTDFEISLNKMMDIRDDSTSNWMIAMAKRRITRINLDMTANKNTLKYLKSKGYVCK